MPVLAPMPSASVRTALAANAGARRIWRSAKRTSCPMDESVSNHSCRSATIGSTFIARRAGK